MTKTLFEVPVADKVRGFPRFVCLSCRVVHEHGEVCPVVAHLDASRNAQLAEIAETEAAQAAWLARQS